MPTSTRCPARPVTPGRGRRSCSTCCWTWCCGPASTGCRRCGWCSPWSPACRPPSAGAPRPGTTARPCPRGPRGRVVLTLVAGVQTALGGDARAELNGRIVSAETARQLLNALTGAGLAEEALDQLRRLADSDATTDTAAAATDDEARDEAEAEP